MRFDTVQADLHAVWPKRLGKAYVYSVCVCVRRLGQAAGKGIRDKPWHICKSNNTPCMHACPDGVAGGVT